MPLAPDLIFLSLERWDDVWRRNQFVCSGLATREPSREILFVTPPRDVSNAIRRLHINSLVTKNEDVSGCANVRVFSPRKWLPNSLRVGRAFNAVTLHRQLAREGSSGNRRILWINDQSTAHLVGRLGECGVVYDVTDDWISLDQPAVVRERIRADDAALCSRADAVIVCSQRLYDMKLPLVGAKRLHLIPNGVDADHYATVRDRSLPVADAARAWPSPVFGYTGTLHPDRVDVALIERVARRMTAGSIVLVGPKLLSADDQAKLLATGRVFFTGPVPYREIPEYMRAFAACIVPHRVTAFTESLNPIKLWEYLAASLPIVSTNVAGFRDFPSLVLIVADSDAFAEALPRVNDEPPERAAERVREARGHSWSSRVDAIEAVLRGVEREPAGARA